jgi:MFS family permease
MLVLGDLLAGWTLITTVALFFGLSSTLYPLSIAYANDYLEPGDIVAASGGFVLVYGIGAVLGPLASSYSMRMIGPSGMFMFIILAAGLLVLMILSRMRIRQWAHVVEKEPYVPAAETPRAVGDLDPRAEVDDGYDQGPDILSTPEVATGEEKSFAFWLGRGGESAEDDDKTNESEILVQVAAEEGTGDSVGKATSKG